MGGSPYNSHQVIITELSHFFTHTPLSTYCLGSTRLATQRSPFSLAPISFAIASPIVFSSMTICSTALLFAIISGKPLLSQIHLWECSPFCTAGIYWLWRENDNSAAASFTLSLRTISRTRFCTSIWTASKRQVQQEGFRGKGGPGYHNHCPPPPLMSLWRRPL